MKQFIQSRNGKKISVLIEGEENTKGLAFIFHGLGGFKEQVHLQAFADVFLEKGFTVVRFDARNTFGESEGRYEEATVENYYEDLEDVINWAQLQPWYREPFALAGHSLGALCVALFAEAHPEKVIALAPISTVVSGRLRYDAETRLHPESLEAWERTGWREQLSESKPGIIKRLPWSYMEKTLTVDLLPNAGKLTMPILLIVGEKDSSTPPEHNQLFFDALPGPKEMHIIANAPHTFRDPAQLQEIKEITSAWLEKISV